MRRSDPAALLYRRRIIILNLQIVTAGLFEIDRIGKMRFVRRSYTFNLVLSFVFGNIFVGF